MRLFERQGAVIFPCRCGFRCGVYMTEYNCPSEFLKVFDRYERPVIEARNQIASEITKEYLEEAAFLKDRKYKP